MPRTLAAVPVLLAAALAFTAVPSPSWASGPTRSEPARKAKPTPKAGTDRKAKPTPKAGTDRTGMRQVGKASIYHHKFAGRRMANGKPMRPHDDNAASKTLPLGTTARVTNLENGQSTVVTIEDRGPYVQGRIVDLSPSSARDIGLTLDEGLATVEVVPIELPGPVGSAAPSR